MPSIAIDRLQLPALPGAARAAVLLLAMGQSGAARLLKHLTPDELRTLRRGAVDQRPVTAQELDALVSEFQEAFRVGPGLSGLNGEMNKLLRESLPEDQHALVFEESLGATSLSVFDELAAMGAEQLAATLAPEHPQLVAIVLSRLEADLTASLVASFPSTLRNDVLRRLLNVRPLDGAAERHLETSLREVFVADTERSGRSARHAGLAEIVNRMDKSQADEMLLSIAETAPEDAAAIRRLLFAFEDLPLLTKKSLLVLFDDVSADVVTNALVGAPDELRETVLSALAARSRRMVEAELASGREIDPKEVVSARRAIAALALRLAREGRVALPVATDMAA